MTQTRVSFTLERKHAAAIFARLEALFEEDGFPLSVFELDEESGQDEISVYVAEGDVETTEHRLVAALPDLSGLVLRREQLPDIDWVAHTLEGLKPVRAGRFLVHGAHDRARRRIGDIGIEIEAGLAFGTGHHGTTSGCLEMIADISRKRPARRALDLGTGSGVLAIALARLGRRPVLATDIDPVAVDVARANARLNHVADLVRCRQADGFHSPLFAREGPFDVIVANILARPLMKLAPAMAANIVPGGSLILSGILERQRNAVLAAYVGQHFRHVRTLHREGWVTLHLSR
jgi:ribosomal protein L11 methyltransferase